MNKKLILVPVAVVAVAATVGGTAAVSQHYQIYQNKLAQEQIVEAKKESDANQAKEAYTKKLESAYSAQRLECEKGLAAYAKLSTLSQKTTAKPQCGTATVR
jgi:hypothetical protein